MSDKKDKKDKQGKDGKKDKQGKEGKDKKDKQGKEGKDKQGKQGKDEKHKDKDSKQDKDGKDKKNKKEHHDSHGNHEEDDSTKIHEIVTNAQKVNLPDPTDGGEAWQRLLEGNKRFVSGHYGGYLLSLAEGISNERKQALANTQSPFAIVVCCSDSRTAPELVFNQGLGHLFVVRVAGNIVDNHALGSIEYAVEHLHSKLLVILGHEKCGAVKAAVDAQASGASSSTPAPAGGAAPAPSTSHVPSLIEKIAPAVTAVKDAGGDVALAAVKQNARNTLAEIQKESKLVADHLRDGTLLARAAVYSLDTGKVYEVQ